MRLLPLTYAARNLGRSPARLAMSVGGAFLVSLLAMGGMAFVLGMDGALRASGHPRNVVLLGAGSEESAERSEIAASTPGVVVASLRGIATIDGMPLASPEVNVALTVDARPGAGGGKPTTGLVRGITPAAFLVHPQVRMVAGRAPEAGSDEVALGRSAARAAGLDPDVVARDLADEEDHRRRVLEGGVHADRGMAGAGPARHHRDARPARELAVGLRHVGGAGLVARVDQPDRRGVVQRVKHLEVALARHAEGHVGAVDEELVDEDPAAAAAVARGHLAGPSCSGGAQ